MMLTEQSPHTDPSTHAQDIVLAGKVVENVSNQATRTSTSSSYEATPLIEENKIDRKSSCIESSSETVKRQDMIAEDQIEPLPKVDVLYSLRLLRGDGGEAKSYYRDTPFGGVNLEFSGSDGPKEDNDAAVMYASADIESQDLNDKAGNTERDWSMNRADFNFGKRFKLDSVAGQHIRIRSARLIEVVESVIDYNPDLYAAGLETHHLDTRSGCYNTLMLYYDDLHRLYRRYTGTLSSDTQRADAFRGINLHENAQIDQFWDPMASSNLKWRWDEGTADDLAALLRLVGPHYDGRIPAIIRRLQLDQPRIPFEYLWLLYKPGTVVYMRKDDRLQGLVVAAAKRKEKDFSLSSEGLNHLTRYELAAWYYEYDGKLLKRTKVLNHIIQYEGDRSVMDLPLIPTRVYDKLDRGVGRQALYTRAETLLQIAREGFAHRSLDHSRFSYRGEIVIDPAEYNEKLSQQIHPVYGFVHDGPVEFEPGTDTVEAIRYLKNSEPEDGRGYRRFTDYHEIDPKDPESVKLLYPDGVLILPARVGGLALGTKKWMRFHVEDISMEAPFTRVKQLRERLVINDDDKEILQTVPLRTAAKHAVKTDFIHGKGEGQVFLLHGPSGTGKSLTAECLAHDTQRPLISLTQGDLIAYAGHLISEDYLRKWFTLAARWDAILLIDEADIFLEKRNASGYHNSLVTIFLRTMEYYAGILFLTTNRPKKIDDAFISRITANIQYHPLSKDARYSVWQRFFDLHEKSTKPKLKITPRAKRELREDDTTLNGREIRNIFQTAISLAMLERQPAMDNQECDEECGPQVIWVDWDHFSKALERHKSFLEYLTGLNRNMDEHKRNMVRDNY
ncbi:hypothetical protein LTR05_008220 [Lithohypha guttulata]|uniref:AAA+ ATPase domain-containing protein n=1 Tax=Lithohypha guttulata TaxID=1690604 RepID=A0AAN7Y3L3_9EURO|nr:hypothetical protein LTR05_008220 [Lithohypha guttulata]